MIPSSEEFQELQARYIFNANTLALRWLIGTPMRPELPDRIVDAIERSPHKQSSHELSSPQSVQSHEDGQDGYVSQATNIYQSLPAKNEQLEKRGPARKRWAGASPSRHT